MPPCCAEQRRPHERLGPLIGAALRFQEQIGPRPGPRPAARAWASCGREPRGGLGDTGPPRADPDRWQLQPSPCLCASCHRPRPSSTKAKVPATPRACPPEGSLSPGPPSPAVPTILHVQNPTLLTPRPCPWSLASPPPLQENSSSPIPPPSPPSTCSYLESTKESVT